MKKIILLSLLGLISTVSFAQWTVTYHQSNLPFIGVNKQIGERWLPEFRVGVDSYIEDLGFELVANYLLKNEEDTQIYVGLGGRARLFPGAVIPLGINYFPFSKKEFGFHLEAAPILAFDDGVIFRGSFGIRYRFLKN